MPRPRRHPHRQGSGTASRTTGVLITVVFGGVFAAAGTAMFVFFTALPLWNIYDARGWTATPCTITHAQVKSSTDSEGDTTYAIDIRYTYQVNGQTYPGDTYRFAPPGSSSGYKGKRKAVDANPVGSTQTCYVDPDDPTRSVIHRGLNAALWWGLFPIPFMAVGYGVLYAGLTGKIKINTRGSTSGWRPADARAKRDALAGTGPAPDDDPQAIDWAEGDGDEPIVMDPGKSRRANFFGMLFFALVWNAIIAVIAYHMLKTAFTGGGLSIELLFVSPFIIIGLVLIGVVIRKLMLVFAPRVVVEIGRDTLPLGGSTLLRWHVTDARKRVDRVQIKLVGQEQATYTRGTDTITDTETFYERWLVGERNDDAVAHSPMLEDHGDIVLRVPADTMHSLNANNNKIVWKLVIRAEVPRWPDPKDEHTITVLPMPIAKA
ncbi:MAG: DUF3592 domain-containing protein [Phycisphaeraceae bacterium]